MLFKIDDKKILNFLFEHKMTVNDFKKNCRISNRTANQIFNGGRLQIPTIGKIAEFLNCSPEELIVK